ncbi:cyclic nucleotide-binding domain-containing protein [Pelosinus sp. UFO1]|uniref:cyclic nucleotide-binding domain-containing protein n=1 Tax=Pelosinus sp. UFO1 TaxID=484770 RepID=UPI0004D11E5C|nr:cyclic nucleotide-binding domain-containing protein [Pelosinus sp. UFO1]AIF49587.1 putative transcriptional regulator, Crp/Fnr family [Pelosinus sp. UFO1]
MGLQIAELKVRTSEVSENRIKIRIASTKREKEAIYKLRYRVYVEEMGKTPIASANHEKKKIMDVMDDQSVLLYAQLGSEVIGTLRVTIGKIELFPSELQEIFKMQRFATFLQGSRNQKQCLSTKMMVISKYRNSQAAYLLLSKGYEVGRDEGVQFSFGGCSPQLVPLYERLGFRRLGYNFFERGFGLIIPLFLILEDLEHLQAVRSPFLRVAKKRNNSPEAAKWFLEEFPQLTKVVNTQLTSKEQMWAYVQGELRGQSIPILKGLMKEEAMQVLHMGTIFHCQEGDTIINTGEVTKELYILLSGKVTVLCNGVTSERVPGQSFGRTGLIQPQVQINDVSATADSEVMVICQQSFEKFYRSYPTIGIKILQNLTSCKG